MGGGRWDSDAYASARSVRASTGASDFKHTDDVLSGKAPRKAHITLDPTKFKNGMRESRDSDEHPETLPIAIFFDKTGSMGDIPRTLAKKLEKLMETVIKKAGVPHPQVLVGAIGDATCDPIPFQAGQFESDNRVDEQLRSLVLDGGGGGQIFESYGLVHYFAAKHTSCDAFEKRGKKGYLFTMGDEASWPVRRSEIQAIFDFDPGQDFTMEQVVAMAQEKWEVYHLRNLDGSYATSSEVRDFWAKLLGERVINVDNSALVCEVIAGIIHALESAKGLDAVVSDLGLSGADAASVRGALVHVGARAVSKAVASGGVPAGHTDGDAAATVTF